MVALIAFTAGWLLLSYIYVFYPLLLAACARRAAGGQRADVSPRVTLVFCAHNEEAALPDKIANCRALDYPDNRLEFCVGGDASTDNTNGLLQAWAARDPRVRLRLSAQREGKTALLNQMIPTATGEVVLFSDASTLFARDAVRRHVSHYADPRVGCVGGNLDFVNASRSSMSSGHGAYWRYERHLRRCESSLGILACVAGANYSMRRGLWRAIEPHFADDCNSPLNVIEQGYKVVYDPHATAQEVAAESSEGLMKRRIRMVTRDLNATLRRPALLNPFRFPGVAWSLWSHKLLRWLGAPLLVVLLVVNLFLLDRPGLAALLALQVAFYLLAIIGYFAQGRFRSRWLSLPLYFALSNLATLLGLANLLRRRRAAIWQPGRSPMTPLIHLFTVDVEDWPQSTLDHSLPIGDRVVANTHRVLELLDEAGVKGTFFVLGKVAEAYPALTREIAAAGHEIATHGYSHRAIDRMPLVLFREELHRSVDLLRQQTGLPVFGHRAADFSISGRSLHLLESLSEEGLIYDSSIFPAWTPRYGIPARVAASSSCAMRLRQDARRISARHDPAVANDIAGGRRRLSPAVSIRLDTARIPHAGTGGLSRHLLCPSV